MNPFLTVAGLAVGLIALFTAVRGMLRQEVPISVIGWLALSATLLILAGDQGWATELGARVVSWIDG